MDTAAGKDALEPKRTELITLFLCGDVMTGRGIDQTLPHPSAPVLHEPYLKDARRYVELTEKITGPVPRSVDSAYIWGNALDELEREAPDLRIINLETSITRSEDYWCVLACPGPQHGGKKVRNGSDGVRGQDPGTSLGVIHPCPPVLSLCEDWIRLRGLIWPLPPRTPSNSVEI